jgi:hypothetical protein
MVQRGVVGGHGEPLPQDFLTCLVLLLHPVEIRQVHVRRRKRGINPERCPVGPLGFHGLAELRLQDAQVEVRLWPVGIKLLGLPILRQRTVECRTLLGGQARFVKRRQYARRFNPHGPDGVLQQWCRQVQPGAGFYGFESRDSRHTDEGIGIREGRLDGTER